MKISTINNFKFTQNINYKDNVRSKNSEPASFSGKNFLAGLNQYGNSNRYLINSNPQNIAFGKILTSAQIKEHLIPLTEKEKAETFNTFLNMKNTAGIPIFNNKSSIYILARSLPQFLYALKYSATNLDKDGNSVCNPLIILSFISASPGAQAALLSDAMHKDIDEDGRPVFLPEYINELEPVFEYIHKIGEPIIPNQILALRLLCSSEDLNALKVLMEKNLKDKNGKPAYYPCDFLKMKLAANKDFYDLSLIAQIAGMTKPDGTLLYNPEDVIERPKEVVMSFLEQSLYDKEFSDYVDSITKTK